LFQAKNSENILHFKVQSSNSKLCFLLEQLKQELNKNEIRELLLAKDNDGKNPLCKAVGIRNNDSNIEIILKFIQDEVDSDTLIEIFSQSSDYDKRILHWATETQNNVATIESLFNVLKNKTNSQQFHQILFLQDNNDETFMSHLILLQSESNIQLLLPFLKDQLGSKLFQKCLYDKESQSNPALFCAFYSKSESYIKYYLNNFLKETFGKEVLKEILLFQNKQKRNILHLHVGSANSKLSILLEHLKQELNKNEIKELLLAKDVDEDNPFCKAVKNNDSDIERILRFIQDEVDSDTLIEIFSQPSFEGRRILHWATQSQMNVAIIESLFNVLKNKTNSQQFHQILFLQDDFSQTFMNYLIRFQSESNIQLLLPFLENELGSRLFQKCLYDKESQCSPALFSAFLSNSESKIKYLFNFLKNQFGKKVFKEMFLFQNNEKRNIMHFNVGSANSKLFFLLEQLKQELNKNEIKELLLARDVQNYNPFLRAVGFENNDSNIKIILKFIQDEVDSDTLIEIFSQTSNQETRILHRATKIQMNVKTIESLFNVLKKKTNSQQFHQILFLQNDFSNIFMNYLIQCQSESNIQLLLTFLENQLGSKLFQKCLYDKESQCNPALFSAFFSNSESKIKYFLNFLKEQFGKEVLKEMFMFQNKRKWNILHYNVPPSNSKLCFLIEHLKQELNKNEIKELLLAKDVDGKNPLCKAVGYTNNDSNIRIMEELLKEYV
jgi:ribosomal protein L7Ae-like RNA K-turn-binding protein